MSKCVHTGLPPLTTIIHPTSGDLLTRENLPPPGTRWTAARKAIVLSALAKKLITPDEALERWSMTSAELLHFQGRLEDGGLLGLRSTQDHDAEVALPTAYNSVARSDEYEAGGYRVNDTNREIAILDNVLYLEPMLRRMFRCFVENIDKVLSRDMLLYYLYDVRAESRPERKIIDVFVCKLRKVLQNLHPEGRDPLETVWGRGYLLRRIPGH